MIHRSGLRPGLGPCTSRDGEAIYGTGEEREDLRLPGGYGYRVHKADKWRITAMLMSHSERSVDAYIRDVRDQPTLGVRAEDGEVAAFLALKLHNEFSAEIYVMAVRRDLHRRGLGRRLVAAAEEYLSARGHEYVQVKTLGPSRPSAEYEATRHFYAACGFRPLEEIHGLWSADNPCLLLVKKLA